MTFACAVLAAALFAAAAALAQPVKPVLDAVQGQRQPLPRHAAGPGQHRVGQRDREGLDTARSSIADRLKALGGEVELVGAGTDVYRMDDTPPSGSASMVRATFKGTGTKKVLLIAHMDTVYRRGMLAQPALPRRRRQGLRPGHLRRQAGHGDDHPHRRGAEAARFPRLRHAHGARSTATRRSARRAPARC